MTAPTLTQLAVEIVRSRRQRSAVFGDGDLFGEPAWDILLALYIAEQGQQKLSVSSVSDAARLPLATGLRWMEKLEKDGWVHRTPDSSDRRRSWVLLTERASNRMRRYLKGIRLRPIQLD